MAGNLTSVPLLWICILVPVVLCKSDVFGQFKKSVTLKCPLEPISQIEWYDWVYSLSAEDPATIFKAQELRDDEYHVGRFSVDINTGQLTISDLNEDDIGTYFCNTTADNKHEFNLILAEMPQCQGAVTGLREDDDTNLECSMKYSGSQAPKLEWLRQEELLESVDMNRIGMATQTVDVRVTYDMDQNTFICRAVLGEMVEDCTLHFQVKYAVREPMIKPMATAYAPGTAMSCVGTGNPVAAVKVTLPGGEMKQGEGQVDVEIPADWEGMDKFLYCEVSNEVDGIAAVKSLNHTFTVSSTVVPGPGESTGSDGGEPTESNKPDNKLAGIVAGLVIGTVLLVIIIILVVCIRRRKANKPPKGSKPVPTKEEEIREETRA